MKNPLPKTTTRILRQLIYILLGLSLTSSVFSQNVGINSTGLAPNPSAGLDVDFPDKGLLIPRIALTGSSSFAPLGATHVAGMLVYNTATVSDVVPGFYYNDGTKWIAGFPSGSVAGNMLYWNGTNWVLIPAGLPGQYLQVSGTNIPVWGTLTPVGATLTTGPVTGITGTTASGGGIISSDGGNAVLQRGLCWNTLTAPTIANTKTSDGSGVGIFSSSLTGLSPATTYYVRAYAMNSNVIVYGNEVSFATSGVLPSLAATTPATSITGSSATSGGNVTSDGGSPITERGICYGTVSNPTTAGLKVVFPTPGTGIFSCNITGLTSGTLYYVRAYAINSLGTSYGTQIFFNTLQIPPTVVTTAATTIGASSATTGGSYTLNGTGGNLWNYGIAYSTSPNSPTPTRVQTGTTPVPTPWTTNLTSLVGNTTYYIRAYIQGYWNGASSYVYGNELTFTTSAPTAPVVASTTALTSITIASAVSGGNITSDGGAAVTSRGVCWATTPNPTIAGSFIASGTGTGVFSGTLSGLSASTTYYVRAFATNSVGTSYGPELSFTTCGTPFYTVGQSVAGGVVIYVDCSGLQGLIASTVDLATNVAWGCSGTLTGASGTAIYTGLANTNAILASCSTPGIPARVCADYTAGGINIPNFTNWYLPSRDELQLMSASGLVLPPSNLYTHWSSTEGSATLAAGWFFYNSSQVSVMKTSATQNVVRAVRKWTAPTGVIATITTNPISAILSTTATGGGNITSDGGLPVTASGICWSTSTSPTTSNSFTNEAVVSGAFVSSLTGLSPSTTYYVRAYATNFAGTAYGNEVSFTTGPPSVASLTTDPTSSPTTTSCISGGNISTDGGSAVTARGVCWSTAANPTIADLKTNDGSGVGPFISNISGLTPGTTYYIRAYATNTAGTAYGNEIVYTTALAGFPVLSTDPVLNLVGALAEGGGTVTDDGGSPITDMGLCWSTSTGPTTTVNLGVTNENVTWAGSPVPFTYFSNMTGLTVGTTYYVRAYATNANGTSYGSEISFVATAAIVGQVIQGGNLWGNVFSVDGTGTHGLIADPWGWGGSDWGCTATLTGASGTAIGTGNSNTSSILTDILNNGCVSPNFGFAAELCRLLGPDWYLPSKDEFDLLWANAAAAGLGPGFPVSGPFWSSSEISATNAWFFDGTQWQSTGLKTDLNTVWPIRSF